jgi:hypothetical protein
MIVDSFTESLELGLESPGQVVVSARFQASYQFFLTLDVAYDPHFRVRMAEWSGDRRISGTRPWCATRSINQFNL